MNQLETKTNQQANELFGDRQFMEILTVTIGGYPFAVPVLSVQEVLLAQSFIDVPLAPPVMKGMFSLRGQIVCGVNMHHRLGMEAPAEDADSANIVIRDGDELFSLVVDEVGEVIEIERSLYDQTPANIEESWRTWTSGVIKLGTQLIVLLDVNALINQKAEKRA